MPVRSGTVSDVETGEASAVDAVALAVEVGARVGELRRQRGWSLSEMARRAGLGKATLSELEAGRRNPTLETLFALTSAMGLPLSAVIPGGERRHQGGPSPAPVVSGSAVDALLLERFDDAGMITELYRLRIRAGVRQISPGHAPGVREYLVVYAGVAEVGDPDDPIVIPAGGHASFDATAPHVYATRDDPVDATLLIRYPVHDTPDA